MKLFTKLLLTGFAVNTVVSILANQSSKKFVKEVNKTIDTPENRKFLHEINVEGVGIRISEVDHVNGYRNNASAFKNSIKVTRSLKEKSYYKAVLDHEIGHVVYAPQLSIFSSTLDLYKCELKADEYSVKQGNLEELIKFRKESFRKTWFVPIQYNTVCLAKLLAVKYFKK